jgi:hypothetical protein
MRVRFSFTANGPLGVAAARCPVDAVVGPDYGAISATVLSLLLVIQVCVPSAETASGA